MGDSSSGDAHRTRPLSNMAPGPSVLDPSPRATINVDKPVSLISNDGPFDPSLAFHHPSTPMPASSHTLPTLTRAPSGNPHQSHPSPFQQQQIWPRMPQFLTYNPPFSNISQGVTDPRLQGPSRTAGPSDLSAAQHSRTSSYSPVALSPQSPIDRENAAILEDKRRRNTAASARFRVKKKQKSIDLARTVADLTLRADELEKEASDLRKENAWLKEIVIMKGKSRYERQIPQPKDPSNHDDDEGTSSSEESPSDESVHKGKGKQKQKKGKGKGTAKDKEDRTTKKAKKS